MVNLKIIRIIYFKEMLDTIRDKRTILVIVISPVVLLLFIMAFPILTMGQIESTVREASAVAVVGEEHAPELYELIAENESVKVVQLEDVNRMNESILDRDVLAVLIIPEDFEYALANETPANITIVYDSTNMRSVVARNKLLDIIENYTQMIVERRLIAHELEPSVIEPINTYLSDIAPEERKGMIFFALMLPMMIVMWAAFGGMNTAIDTTAGEKERHTLEALLVTPPSRTDIVLGKFLTVFTISMLTTFIILLCIVVPALVLSKFIEPYGALYISPLALVILIVAVILLMVMANALEIALCTFAKSVKEAQYYFMPLVFLMIIPVLFMPVFMVMGEEIALSTFAIPIINVLFLLQEVLMGLIIISHVVLVLISTAIFAVITLAIAKSFFSRESILFRT
jgi:sodium transport system permease protein